MSSRGEPRPLTPFFSSLRFRLVLLLALAAAPFLASTLYLAMKERLVAEMLLSNSSGLATIAAVAFAVVWFWGNRSLLRRVSSLVSAAKQLESGNLTARVGPPYEHGELGKLAQTFDAMAASLQKNAALLHYRATHDALTGLPNRNFFIDHLNAEISTAKEGGRRLALLLMDLDRFREINDTIGHGNGDLLIKSATERLKRTVGRNGIIARLGGDEFAVLLPDVGRDGAIAAAQGVLEAFRPPFILEDLPITSDLSIGIALHPEHGDSLVRQAEVAMYFAKEEKTGYALYAAEKDRYSPDQLTLLTDLRRAIEGSQLYLVYQPKIDLRTGNVEAVEALVRWRHPKLGVIPPDRFVGLAERTGLIKGLTAWVLNEALRQCEAFRQQGVGLRVAVNISARSLEASLPEQIAAALRRYKLAPQHLEIEMTEGNIMRDPVHSREVLGSLRRAGVEIAIDDFGTGYSSLSYLSRLPVDRIKIDRSFVTKMANDERAAVIVRSTVELAHRLGLEVVAEGVESDGVLARLRSLGCDSAQGYYISRPLRAPELLAWLANRPRVARSVP
jgi:diguanylate cyclase (GGDEF)-like protein